MYKIKLLNKLTFILLCSFMLANAASGPEYRSLRVHGMGGAFVAVVDNKDALYYNPAGLNLMNRLGNFEKNPDMGYMPRKRYEFRLFSISTSLPANVTTNALRVCGAPTVGKMVKKVVFLDFAYLRDVDWCPAIVDIFPDDTDQLSDSLIAHQELAKKLASFDRLPLEVGVQISYLEFAMHNFGFSVWTNTSALAPYIDVGAGIPGFGYEPVQADMVAQTALAFSPVDNWSVGIGLKMVKRYREPYFEFWPDFSKLKLDSTSYQEQLDTLEERWRNFTEDSLFNFSNRNFALDFGVLYQITREIRLGTSLRNVFFSELAGESITPNWSIGAMASPMILQSNSWWGRKVNFAIDYVDILDGTVGDMFLAHLNFGAEIEQVVLPILLKVYLGGGFEGGYYAWNTGFSIADVVNMRFGSYAEERGVRTGQKEQRFWTGEVSVGF